MTLRRFEDIACFDDYRVGDRFVTEPVTVTREALLAYVERHGPVPLRTNAGSDRHLARETFPDLATLCLCFSHLIHSGFLRGHGMSSPGLKYLRCPEPVVPGDRVRVELECLEVQPSRSRDDRGYATFAVQMIAERGALLVEFEVAEVVLTRRAVEHQAQA
jgi:hypothetical protein